MERVKRHREEERIDDRHTRPRTSSSAAEPAASSGRSPAKHGLVGPSGYDRQEASRDPWGYRNEGGGGFQQERRQQEQPACGPLPEGE